MVQKSGLPYVHISEVEQKGNSFGERFANAIVQVYQLGFDHVISIGNDAPQLTVGHLKQAARRLSEGQQVLGPAQDGGFYLMGLQKAHFNYHNFVALPWQTSTLSHAFAERILTSKETVFYLGQLRDIDSFADISVMVHLNVNLTTALLKMLRSIIGRCTIYFRRNYYFHSNVAENQQFNKGSPLLPSL